MIVCKKLILLFIPIALTQAGAVGNRTCTFASERLTPLILSEFTIKKIIGNESMWHQYVRARDAIVNRTDLDAGDKVTMFEQLSKHFKGGWGATRYERPDCYYFKGQSREILVVRKADAAVFRGDMANGLFPDYGHMTLLLPTHVPAGGD